MPSDVHYLVFPKIASFLAANNYRSPDDAFSGPFQWALNTKDHFFEWLRKRETEQSAFNHLMQSNRGRKYPYLWPEIFPARAQLSRFRDANTSEGFRFVDIGGGTGQEIECLLDIVPDLSGLFVLQDIPEAIAGSILGELKHSYQTQKFKVMEHDFFRPQPVKGANVYFLGRVLHDWPDIQARQILGHIREAMDEHSILLVHDRVFPDSESEVYQSDVQADFIMMAAFASLERSGAQFQELIQSVGLQLVRVWRPEGSLESRQAVLEIVKG